MPGIGALYYEFRGDGARLRKDAQVEGQKAADVGAKSFAGKWKASLKQTFSGAKGGILGGLGLGAGLGAVQLASAAVGQLTQVLGDSVQAALEEEKSVEKLGAALRANIPDWDGNTKAIEDTLAARMRLGFADDEQRESLATLVAVTKDATKALELQRTAMDLARLRNIDLAAASDIVGKVYGGNIGILSRYGIAIKKGATATEAMAELTKLAAGQAEAYAETNQGKLLASQIRVGEVMEKIGQRILPLVIDTLETAAGIIEGVAGAVESLTSEVDNMGTTARTNEQPIDNLANLLEDLGHRGDESQTFIGALDEGLTNLFDNILDGATFWDGYTDAVEDQQRAAKEAIVTARETSRAINFKSTAAAAEGDLGDVSGALDDVGDAAARARRRSAAAATQMVQSFRDWRDQVISAARDVVDKAYQVIEDKSALTAANVEKDELRKVIATGKATADQKARFKELTGEQADLLLSLAENGAEDQKIVTDTIKDLKKDLKTATGNERKAIQATIDAINRLIARTKILKAQMAGLAGARANINKGSEQIIGGNYARAAGGPVTAGQAYTVGEVGRELFVPNVSGTIIPTAQTERIMASGSDSTTINLSLTGAPLQAQSPADVVRELRRASRLGLTPPRRVKAFAR